MEHPYTETNYVRYYYLPERYGNCAEIIKVIYSTSYTVEVPMWEENVTLKPFHTRLVTQKEKEHFTEKETWEIFFSWDMLSTEEQKHKVDEHELQILEHFKNKLSLPISLIP